MALPKPEYVKLTVGAPTMYPWLDRTGMFTLTAFLALVAKTWLSGHWQRLAAIEQPAPAGSLAVSGPVVLVSELIRPPVVWVIVTGAEFWKAVVHGMPAKEANAVPF